MAVIKKYEERRNRIRKFHDEVKKESYESGFSEGRLNERQMIAVSMRNAGMSIKRIAKILNEPVKNVTAWMAGEKTATE